MEQFLKDSAEVSKMLRVVGAGLGALLTVSAISHDRHNLFLLLFVLVVWPFISQMLNLYALLFKDEAVGRLIRLLGHRWSPLGYVRDMVSCIARWPDRGRCWFLYQIQVFNMAFSIACVMMYWLILTFSNVSITWSSTFCGADRPILFLLDLIALPWFFSEAAQPSMALLECTRVDRPSQCPLNPIPDCTGYHWWRYVLAAHITYCLTPRLAFWLYARYNFHHTLRTAEITYTPQPHTSIWEGMKTRFTRLSSVAGRGKALWTAAKTLASLPKRLKTRIADSMAKAKSMYDSLRNR